MNLWLLSKCRYEIYLGIWGFGDLGKVLVRGEPACVATPCYRCYTLLASKRLRMRNAWSQVKRCVQRCKCFALILGTQFNAMQHWSVTGQGHALSLGLP